MAENCRENWAIAFSRYPQPGQTKTRLIPALGARGAAWLQRLMTERTLAQLRGWRQDSSGQIEVRYVGASERAFRGWLGADVGYRPQGTGDLGDRLQRALAEAFAAGAQRAIVVGIDCPPLEPSYVREALAALVEKDVVLGKATDGGYYLVGVRRSVSVAERAALFRGIDWGSDRVFAQTLERVRSQQLTIAQLAPLSDVDRPEDLWLWDRSLGRDSQRISVVIPVFNEAPHLRETLSRVLSGGNVEAIVVDGGSTDKSERIACEAGVQVIRSRPGRAWQMNRGARAATGEILLFLHGDTLLPKGFEVVVRQVLASTDVVAGAFELQIAAELPGLRMVERVANWRSRTLQFPYGDQGLFLSRDRFHQLGGVPEQPLMEDFELVRRLQRHGKIEIPPIPLLTSGRRWQRLGVFRTTTLNQIIVLAYLLGVSPEILAKWYRKA